MSTPIEVDDDVTELISYVCADCGSNDWTLRIGQRDDGKTFLIVSCGNKVCLQKKRIEVGASEDALLVWDEFPLPDDSPYARHNMPAGGGKDIN